MYVYGVCVRGVVVVVGGGVRVYYGMARRWGGCPGDTRARSKGAWPMVAGATRGGGRPGDLRRRVAVVEGVGVG